jgi:signal peptidase I
MHPAIKDGEIVMVKHIEPSKVKRGDIILYKACEVGGSVIAHRVITVNKRKETVTSFVLRGDASQTCDLPITPEQILGKVISVERAGRKIDLAGNRAKALWIVRLCALLVRSVYGNQG